jgi:hypothetical protein
MRRPLLLVLALLVAGVAAASSASVAAGAPKPYLGSKFTNRSVATFTKDLAKVGIGVYRPGTGRAVRRIRGRMSPLRLSSFDAPGLAAGAWAGAGLSGAALNELGGSARVTRKVSLTVGAVVAGWAKRARSPSARLARRILGRQDWRHYRTIVFPQAVLTLFSSDAALHIGRAVKRSGAAAHVAAFSDNPCSGTLNFINGTINRFFDSIGQLQTDERTIRKLFGRGWLGDLVKGIGDVLAEKVNVLVNKAREITLATVKLPIEFVTKAVAGVSATVGLINQVANAVLPWQGRLRIRPNPTRRAVAEGVPGTVFLDVTAPGSNRSWSPWVADCAKVFDFDLPDFTPKGADVSWDLSLQAPGGLVTPTVERGRLNDKGHAELAFSTTPETPEEAKGEPSIGLVNVVATLHRRDLDGIIDRVAGNLLKLVPGIIRDNFGAQIRAVVDPMINRVKAKIGTLQDIELGDVLAVSYHKSKGPKKKPPAGGARLPLPDPCKLVTQGEAGAAAGMGVLGGAPGSAPIAGLGTSSACIFADPSYPARAFVRIDAIDAGEGAFAAYKAGSGLNGGHVPGLGDDNFFYSTPGGGALLFVRKSNIVLDISVLTANGLNGATQLARAALNRF